MTEEIGKQKENLDLDVVVIDTMEEVSENIDSGDNPKTIETELDYYDSFDDMNLNDFKNILSIFLGSFSFTFITEFSKNSL